MRIWDDIIAYCLQFKEDATCRCCASETRNVVTDSVVQQYIQMFRVRKASCRYYGRFKDGC